MEMDFQQALNLEEEILGGRVEIDPFTMA